MSSYEKGFLSQAQIADFKKYQERMNELLHIEESEAAEASAEAEEA